MTAGHLILGGPGTGKTHHLLARVEEALGRGVPPDRVAFCGFTNAAVDEARNRACARFGLTPKDLPYFRTLHSLCFHETGLDRGDVVTEAHLREVGEITGELYGGDWDAGPAAGRNADPLLTLDHYARTTRRGLRAAWEDHGGNVDWFRLLRFSEAYRLFKQDRGLLDFTDMLEAYLSDVPLDVDEAVLDEAQDLSELQWAVADLAFGSAATLYVAGDDDQSIHRWAGASEERFMSLPHARIVLPTSHRLPSRIFGLAQGVVGRIGRRYVKEHHAGRDGGEVVWAADATEADLSSGTWLLLARTRAQLPSLAQAARDQGVVYAVKGRCSVDADHVRAIVVHEALRAGKRAEGEDCAAALSAAGADVSGVDVARSYTAAELGYDASPVWHDALVRIPLDDREYYLACRRRGEDLRAPPRVRVETIHGAKGAEADNVLLATDLTYRVNRGRELDPDSEERVLYVALTRASKRLILLAPTSAYWYMI